MTQNSHASSIMDGPSRHSAATRNNETGSVDSVLKELASKRPPQAIDASALLMPSAPRPGHLRRMVKIAATALCISVAILSALVIWEMYVNAPWTRDGRVRVQVANIAPQISGQITEVHVVDNQFVHAGDVLYVIDQFDYRVALAKASAEVKQRGADLQVKRQQAERRLHLTDLATTAEEQQVYAGQATDAEALFEAAVQQQAQAEVNLARTEVRSPVNGFVTNLLMRVGDYARPGVTNVYVVDTDSYWIDGYFEETKLARLCVGDQVEARLLGFREPIIGRIESVTRGISVSDATPSIQGLPNVNAVYTWVRLAQRVPVRIRIIRIPSSVPLVAGLTATVIDRSGTSSEDGSLLGRAYTRVVTSVSDAFAPPSRGPGCIPPTAGPSGARATISGPTSQTDISPSRFSSGLAPGLNARPKYP
jgi:multidrug resistance efflux pump